MKERINCFGLWPLAVISHLDMKIRQYNAVTGTPPRTGLDSSHSDMVTSALYTTCTCIWIYHRTIIHYMTDWIMHAYNRQGQKSWGKVHAHTFTIQGSMGTCTGTYLNPYLRTLWYNWPMGWGRVPLSTGSVFYRWLNTHNKFLCFACSVGTRT